MKPNFTPASNYSSEISVKIELSYNLLNQLLHISICSSEINIWERQELINN